MNESGILEHFHTNDVTTHGVCNLSHKKETQNINPILMIILSATLNLSVNSTSNKLYHPVKCVDSCGKVI